MGIDIGAPAGTDVKSFYGEKFFLFKNNNLELDYGYTIITRHNSMIRSSMPYMAT